MHVPNRFCFWHGVHDFIEAFHELAKDFFATEHFIGCFLILLHSYIIAQLGMDVKTAQCVDLTKEAPD
ncbi:hypothetical protein D3C87_1678480 [compost metagenome]